MRNITALTVKPDSKQAGEYSRPVTGPTSGLLGPAGLIGGIQDEKAYYPASRHGVAGIVVFRSEPTGVDIKVNFHEREGLIVKDVYLNFAYISPQDPVVPLMAGKWNQSLFYNPTTPIAEAISSIPKDVEVTIWSSQGQGYKSSAPAWANDLKELKWGVTYYFWVSKDTTWIYGN